MVRLSLHNNYDKIKVGGIMYNFQLIDKAYQKYSQQLDSWIPEGIYAVNLELLERFDLLKFQPPVDTRDPLENRVFQIVDAADKITLVNDEFVVWIVPIDHPQSMTQILIALNKDEGEPQLEAAFIASGVYNSSKMVLKVLEKFLNEIHETEISLSKYNKTS